GRPCAHRVRRLRTSGCVSFGASAERRHRPPPQTDACRRVSPSREARGLTSSNSRGEIELVPFSAIANTSVESVTNQARESLRRKKDDGDKNFQFVSGGSTRGVGRRRGNRSVLPGWTARADWCGNGLGKPRQPDRSHDDRTPQSLLCQ